MAGTMELGNAPHTNRLRPLIWGAAALLLSLPALAMHCFPGSGVNWTALDFVVMGIILALACGAYELGAWASGQGVYRAGFGLAVLAGLIMTWINLAVGIIGGEHEEANWVFLVVLLVGIAGALVARFRAAGMVRALVATAIAQAIVAVVAFVISPPQQPEGWLLSIFFTVVWLASAALFRMAAQGKSFQDLVR